jgi:hypothetical protein
MIKEDTVLTKEWFDGLDFRDPTSEELALMSGWRTQFGGDLAIAKIATYETYNVFLNGDYLRVSTQDTNEYVSESSSWSGLE